MSIDFARANMLMETIVKAGQHGPMYQKLAGYAGEELKEMIDKEGERRNPKPKEPKPVTPAAGPANAQLELPSGEVVDNIETINDGTHAPPVQASRIERRI